MVDLSTSYLGLSLKNPLIASASPLSQKVSTVQALEQKGIAAIVVYSLFEEQITMESLKLHDDLMRTSDTFAEAHTGFPDLGLYKMGPEPYLDHLRELKKAVKIPVIASLNGVSQGGWIDYAQKIEQTGVDALELNIYYLVTDPNITAAQLEDDYINLVRNIRQRLSIPLAVKLSPFFSSLPNFTKKLVEAGANGLVLFNRFYQPDFDLENLEVVPHLVLSHSDELRLPLRWIAILYGKIKADLALTSGVHNAEDMLKSLMAGASVVMVASEFLQNGIDQASNLLTDMQSWLEAHEYISVKQMIGSMSQQAVADPATFERVNYMKVLSSYVKR
ncbi:MAG: dihydroorotate dehydrogenase-like protein [Anaerolineales bacterium]|nr:dihydroorotate dehydrogenase-like protein [Anaerolineales bacterium]